jgi:hypothetical protein
LIRAEEVLDLMGLARQRDRRVANLSGGEARRLHVGVELLASPAVVILDEPLAGLDPGLIGKFMQLFRRICDKGHTLILVTHNLEKLELCDRAVYIQAGKVLFSGAPRDICAHFGVEDIAQIYDQANLGEFDLEARLPVTEPITVMKTPHPHPRAGLMAALRHPLMTATLFTRQAYTLTVRYGRVYLRDKRNMLLLMAQTPLITMLLGLVYKFDLLQFPISFYFCLTVTGIWVGGLDAVREVAAELPLLARESKCGLNRISYVTARVVTAAALSASQAILFMMSAVVIFVNLEFSAKLLILLFAAIISGNLLGLAVSVCSGSVSRAISTLPIVLIPQIFFSGILVQFEHMAELGRQISHLTVSRQGVSVMKHVFFLDRPLFWHSDWTELFLLCTGLIIIFWVALRWRTNRGSAA